MSEINTLKQRADENDKICKRLIVLGSTVSVGALVLSTASVLAPLAVGFVGTMGVAVAFVGSVGKLSQPELRALQQEKVNELLTLGNLKIKETASNLELDMERNADHVEDGFMKATLATLGAVVLPSSLPVIFPAALLSFGVYKAFQVVQDKKGFDVVVKNISSLHDEVVSKRTSEPTVLGSPKPKF